MKAQTTPSELKSLLTVVLFCMVGLVASLVLTTLLTGEPNLSDIALLIDER